ncbi:MAG: RNA polymerase-binding protein DksA [Gammaproteobacteria bacterium]|nr:RNA polymerase-binding protein DksA [Gammaproteobacteria bacterium]NND46719.1 RNA polymerase-binding protein DksA [Woeseiaceae bacterium]
MPVKKAASKKRKQTRSRKKAVTRKSTAKKKVAKKKATSKKKAPVRKRVTKKKAASKKKAVGKKKVAGKKKTTGKKKAASKKKAAGKKKVTRKKKVRVKKKATRKVGKKKAASKKKAAAKKKPATKKRRVSKKKSASKKRPASKKKLPLKKRVPARTPAARKTPARPRKSRGSLLSGPIHGIAPYKRKRGEEYMSEAQIEHFRKILSAWKRELIFEVDRTVHHMQDEAANFPDPNDRATQESEFGLELRTRDRERKLLRKIDQALVRLDEGTYGYCDETGEEIGLKRLEARPVATLSLEAQERRELAERQFRDRDDRYR